MTARYSYDLPDEMAMRVRAQSIMTVPGARAELPPYEEAVVIVAHYEQETAPPRKSASILSFFRKPKEPPMK